MKRKIVILGSTGSIGIETLKIIKNKKINFNIVLLSCNKNASKIFKQAKEFIVKNVIITNKKKYLIWKNKFKKNKIKLFNNFESFKKIFPNKTDYVMSAITGINGLFPTIKIIQYTNNIAIANKESIICGWGLIKKELKKYKTNFIPVDSEHFSLWFGLKNINKNLIEKIYITASGGPFFKTPLNKFKKIKINQALNHPNWKMGNKISIDSATMINKVYEVIEARNIFDLPYKKIDILIHPKSYIHAIIKLKNGLIKIIAHDTTMKIPIFNTLFFNSKETIKTRKLNIISLNNLNFNKVESKRYPIIKLLNSLPLKHSLYETIIVSANDELVKLFLEKKLNFNDISKKLLRISNLKEFDNFKNKYPKNLSEIINLNRYVRFKINSKSV